MQYRRDDARYSPWHDAATGDDEVRIDTVSPLDPEAMALLNESWFDETALPALIRAAVQSRRLANEYGAVAGGHFRDARAAAIKGDAIGRHGLLRQARRARRDAQTCEAFAMTCEKRGNELALVYGFSPATTPLSFATLASPAMGAPLHANERELLDC